MTASENLFEKTCPYKTASIVVQAAPWEVTSSYGGGSSLGPKNIVQASGQLDFFNFTTKAEPNNFIYMNKIDQNILALNNKLQKNAQKIMQARGPHGDKQINSPLSILQQEINTESSNLNNTIYKNTIKVLTDKKIPALLGGDHSVSFGAIQACLEKHKNLSILHIDAHADLRKSYQGFTHSHASIMYNVMELNTAPEKLCSVGVRDFCEQEYNYAQKNSKIKIFFDTDLKASAFQGALWADQCKQIISELGKSVYISFDVDGLQPSLCPNTGTPVPGGLSYNEALFLLTEITRQNKKIIGFDLCEVSCGNSSTEWNANIGARLLLEMSFISHNQML